MSQIGKEQRVFTHHLLNLRSLWTGTWGDGGAVPKPATQLLWEMLQLDRPCPFLCLSILLLLAQLIPGLKSQHLIWWGVPRGVLHKRQRLCHRASQHNRLNNGYSLKAKLQLSSCGLALQPCSPCKPGHQQVYAWLKFDNAAGMVSHTGLPDLDSDSKKTVTSSAVYGNNRVVKKKKKNSFLKWIMPDYASK